MNTSVLIDAAAELGVALTALQAQRLLDYEALVKKWNRGMNLVSRQDIARFTTRHLLDSLAAAPQLAGRVLDIGSGAGLPGVPLAVARPELSFTLVDRMARRVRFLKQVCLELSLDNVETLTRDMRSSEPLDQEPFDRVVARAVTDEAGLWAMAEPWLAPAGSLLVYRSTQGTDEALPVLQGVAISELTYTVPGLNGVHTLLKLDRR